MSIANEDESEVQELGFEGDSVPDLTRDRWVQAQRDLITTTLDYNLSTIAGLVSDGRIDLNPTFQRRDRWDRTRRSRLIESFLMNVPLPPVFLNEDDYGQYSIIDGKQRLTTVHEFLYDQFPLVGLEVFQEANGLTFSQLDRSLRSVLETRASLRAIILLRLSDPLIKYHVFQRLNTGGVRLNAQEVRNVTFTGSLNNRLQGIAENPEFGRMLGVSPDAPEKSALWKQMRDVELVLRYFTLSDGWGTFAGSLGGAMNEYMAEHHGISEPELDSLNSRFDDAIRKVAVSFGNEAFRRWDPSRRLYGSQPLATLFDAQMIAVEGVQLDLLSAKSAELQNGMRDLFIDEEFARSIASQTNTPSFVRARIQMAKSMVERVVGA